MTAPTVRINGQPVPAEPDPNGGGLWITHAGQRVLIPARSGRVSFNAGTGRVTRFVPTPAHRSGWELGPAARPPLEQSGTLPVVYVPPENPLHDPWQLRWWREEFELSRRIAPKDRYDLVIAVFRAVLADPALRAAVAVSLDTGRFVLAGPAPQLTIASEFDHDGPEKPPALPWTLFQYRNFVPLADRVDEWDAADLVELFVNVIVREPHLSTGMREALDLAESDQRSLLHWPY